MKRYIIGSLWDRSNRNGANANFEYLFEGRQKIDELNNRAESILSEAQQTNDMNKDVQAQVNTFISEFESTGETNLEVVQARKTLPVLSERLEAENKLNDHLINQSFTTLKQGKKKKKPLVSFILDDGQIKDNTDIRPIAEDKNVPFGIGVITSSVGKPEFMTWEQLRELENTGLFEIMSHTHNHEDLATYTEEELINDLETTLSILKENSFNPEGFVYPFNSDSLLTREVVGRYFNYSFAKISGINTGMNTPIINNQSIRRVALGSYFDSKPEPSAPATDTLAYYKWQVDKAVENDNWLVFVLHPQQQDSIQLTHLRGVIDYIKSLGVDIVKPSEGFEIYGNIIEVNGFKIDQQGIFHSADNRLVIEPTNSRDSSDTVLQYPGYKITQTTYNNAMASSEGLPEKRSGILTTYNLDANYSFRYQKYLVLANNNEYIRRVDSNYDWLDWQLLTPYDAVKMVPYNSMTAMNVYTDFPQSAITHNTLTVHDGLPINKNGILITNRSESIYWSTRQQFIVPSTINGGVTKKYERYVDSSGAWGDWEEQ